jgi:hypothetical protein
MKKRIVIVLLAVSGAAAASAGLVHRYGLGLVADPPATTLRELLAHRREFGSGVATQDYPSSYMRVDSYTFEPDGRYSHEHRVGAPSSPARTLRTGTWTLAGRNAACIVLDPPGGAPAASSGAR